MLDQGGDWLPKLMTDSGRTGFLSERARASGEFRKVVMARRRSPSGLDMAYGLPLQWTGGAQPDQWLSDLLDGGHMIAGGDVAEACAFLAISYACEKSLTFDPGDVFQTRARYFYTRWTQKVASISSVGIDTNDDQTADIWIDLSRLDTR